MNNIKSTLAAVAVLALGSSAFGGIILSEDFEAAPYAFTFENYGGGATNTYSAETISPLSGLTSLRMDITNSGDAGNWWALQVRTPMSVVAGKNYEVSFKVSSTAGIDFLSRFEAAASVVTGGSHNQHVILTAGQSTTFTYTIDTIVGTGGGTFMFALGDSTPGAATVMFDDVSINEVIPEPATFSLLGLAAAGLFAARRFRN